MSAETPKSRPAADPPHLSGHLHVTGASRFIGEDVRPAGLLHVKVVTSPHAHARITAIDTAAAAARPGVAAVLTHRDIPGANKIGHVLPDEPLLPADTVTYVGQPVALVAAADPWQAEAAAAAVRVEYEPLPPVLTIEEALARGQLYVPERRIARGDVDAALAAAPHVLEGQVATGAQEHFYLETQRCVAVPAEDGQIVLYAATQSTAEVQEIAARVLGRRSKDITVDVPRLGGAFGGKERSATLWACLAALACHCTGRPAELALQRVEDAAWTGKRHPYESRYRVGFDDEGRLLAWDVELNANGGAAVDLSLAILERSMLHADNAYHIPAARIVGRACRTNLPPNTAFRGFGAPQGIFVIECALERIARALGLDPLEVRRRNAYQEGQLTPFGQPVHDAHVAELLERLGRNARYAALRAENEAFNAAHVYAKRGLGVVPVKFGISFTSAFLNQGSALIWIYADGTLSLSHGGVEMGQEVNTKVAQVVARTLGVGLGRIRVETANTKRVANASPTAASTGADINGNAARVAAAELRARLARVAAGMLAPRLGRTPEPDALVFADDAVWDTAAPAERLAFGELVHQAYMDRVDLGAHGFYRTPGVHFDRTAGQGTPFHYFAQGGGLVQVEVDLISGCARLLKVHIVHETGRSLNLAVDRGQIAGAFVQGFGWCTIEEERFDAAGRWLAVSPSTYKIPTIRDVPDDFVIETVERDLHHASVLGSKAIGEPPLVYGEAAWFAVKDAIESLTGHRREAALAHPATPDAVLAAVAALLSRS